MQGTYHLQGHYQKKPVFLNTDGGVGNEPQTLMLWFEPEGLEWWVTDVSELEDTGSVTHLAKGVPFADSRWVQLDECSWHVPYWSQSTCESLWVGDRATWLSRVCAHHEKYEAKVLEDKEAELAEVKTELAELKKLLAKKENPSDRQAGGYMNKLVAIDVAYTSMRNYSRVAHLLARFKSTSEIYTKTYKAHKQKVDEWGFDKAYDY